MSKQTWIIAGIVGALFLFGGSLSLYPAIVQRFARAVAVAERGQAEIDSGNILNNNPGNIEKDGSLIEYQTLQDGWNALYHQINLMFNGTSIHYSPDMTIAQVGYIYADGLHDPQGANNWINNVSSILGVSPDTPLNQLT